MFRNKKKVLALTISVLILFLAFGATSYAANVQSTLTAQFKALKILLNGSQVTMESQPIIVNGSTYLPLRAFANMFNKNVDWNASLQQISITDRPDNEIASLKAKIIEKDNQILILQAQLEGSEGDIDDLEDQLNDDYGDYEDFDWTITLSGDEDDIKVKVDVDEDDWDDLTSTKQTRIIQNICDDIADEFEDADITGDVKDSSRTLESFEVKSNGDVEFESSGDLGDIEDDLNSDSDFNELGDIDDLEIVLDGDEDDITFTVEIDYDEFEDEWDELANSDLVSYMNNIQEYILDEIEDTDYEDADVEGEIVDTSDGDEEMATFSKSNAFWRSSDYAHQ